MITIYGEILIDMNKKIESNSFDYFVGGAPFNVAYAIMKTEGNVKFIGNVGNDLMGKHIKSFVINQNMDSSFISIDNNHNTTLAFVINDENGERNFCFARKNGADYYLKKEYLEEIKKADIVHIGSLMISEDYGYEYAKSIIEEAEKYNKKISFDINYRDDIFSNKNEAIKRYREIYNKCDVVKVSKEELYLFTEEYEIKKGLLKFAKENQKVFVTLGKEGSLLYSDNKIIEAKSININPIDTTGAGDAFYGTILSFIDQIGYEEFFCLDEKISDYLYLANIQGALATLKKGALDGVVSKQELLKNLK